MFWYFYLLVLAADRSNASPTVTTDILSRDLPPVESYGYVGCWAEPANVRALTNVFYASDNMTLEYCASSCAGVYQFFGLEYSRECYCGSTLSAGTLITPEAECNLPCAANSSEICGAGNRLSLYNSTTIIPPPPKPTNAPKIGAYAFIGCQTEATDARALTGLTIADDFMTNELCASSCDGYKYFGTEYGRECYCGNSLTAGSVPAPLADCSFTCPGNVLEYCGSNVRLNLYSVVGGSPSPTPSPTSSKTSSSSTKPTLTSSSTLSSSSSKVSSSSTKVSTSSVLSSSSAKTSSSSTKASSTSSKTSSSSSSKITSSSTKLSSSSTSSKTSTITTSTRSSTSTKVTSSSTTKTPSSSVPVKSAWSSVGCFADPDGHNMALLFKSDYMNPALCISAASARLTAAPATTYKYIGVEHGRDCYGATAAPNPIPTSLVGRKACTVTCAGNVAGKPVETCGGRLQYNLYASVTGSAFSGPIPIATTS